MATLPSYGNLITFSNILSQFGGTLPILASAYYSSGALTAGVSNVPANGQLLISGNFGGKARPIQSGQAIAPSITPSNVAMRLVANSNTVLQTSGVVTGGWVGSALGSTSNVFAQSTTSARPTFAITGGGVNGNLPYVSFNSASSQFLQNTTSAFSAQQASFGGLTFIAYVKYNNETESTPASVFAGTGGAGSNFQVSRTGSNMLVTIGQIGETVQGIGYAPGNTWILQATRFTNTTRAFDVFYENIANKTTVTAASNLSTNFSFGNDVYIGRNTTAGVTTNMHVNFMILYDRALSDSDLGAIMSQATKTSSVASFDRGIIELRANALSNNQVSTWEIFTQSTTNKRPLWYATGGYSNGMYVQFNGTTTTMNNTVGVSLPVSTFSGITFAMLYKITQLTTGGWERILQSRNSENNSEAFVVNRSGTSSNLMIQLYTTTPATVVRQEFSNLWTPTNGWKVLVWRFANGRGHSLWHTGSSNPNFNFTTTPAATNLGINTGAMWLGSEQNSTNSFGYFQLGGLTIINRAVNNSEAIDLYSYFARGFVSS